MSKSSRFMGTVAATLAFAGLASTPAANAALLTAPSISAPVNAFEPPSNILGGVHVGGSTASITITGDTSSVTGGALINSGDLKDTVLGAGAYTWNVANGASSFSQSGNKVTLSAAHNVGVVVLSDSLTLAGWPSIFAGYPNMYQTWYFPSGTLPAVTDISTAQADALLSAASNAIGSGHLLYSQLNVTDGMTTASYDATLNTNVAIPEPASLALLGLGSSMLLLRGKGRNWMTKQVLAAQSPAAPRS